MGCHTWFYKSLSNPTRETMKNFIRDKVLVELEFLDRLINNREEIDSDLLESYPEWTVEYALENTKSWNKILDFIHTGEINLTELSEFFGSTYTKENLLENLYCFLCNDIIEYIDGRGFFKDCDEFHDVFRKWGYPDDKLFSLEETLEYINNPENECKVYEHTEERLKEFWKKYPDGMITFG